MFLKLIHSETLVLLVGFLLVWISQTISIHLNVLENIIMYYHCVINVFCEWQYLMSVIYDKTSFSVICDWPICKVCDMWKVIWAATWQNQQSDCAPSEDSDQPRHPPSLIRVFAVRIKKVGPLATHWAHSEDSDQTGRISESSLGAKSFCWFRHVAAHLILYDLWRASLLCLNSHPVNYVYM